jgi:hypothetical protein
MLLHLYIASTYLNISIIYLNLPYSLARKINRASRANETTRANILAGNSLPNNGAASRFGHLNLLIIIITTR